VVFSLLGPAIASQPEHNDEQPLHVNGSLASGTSPPLPSGHQRIFVVRTDEASGVHLRASRRSSCTNTDAPPPHPLGVALVEALVGPQRRLRRRAQAPSTAVVVEAVDEIAAFEHHDLDVGVVAHAEVGPEDRTGPGGLSSNRLDRAVCRRDTHRGFLWLAFSSTGG
jgi:hypothetical protein